MILHVDMDAFYASVEIRDRPELATKPVVVGGTPEGRGVVAAANYVAREFGVHSAMPAATAKRRCPHAVFLPSRIGYYAQISREIHRIFQQFTSLVEPLSLDEAFLDVRGSPSCFGSAVNIGEQIKQTIREQLNLVASVGVAPNKFLAKVASDIEKPDGFVVVNPDQIQSFLDPLPVERLWGVGRQGSRTFHRLGIRTIRQVRELPCNVLRHHVGEAAAEHFWRLARGIDDRLVIPDAEAKTISHETTFEADIEDRDVLRAWLLELTEQVARRLRRLARKGRTIHVKVRFPNFRTIVRSRTLPAPSSSTHDLFEAAAAVLDTCLPEPKAAIRLIGVGISGLDRSGQTQGWLFDQHQRDKQAQLDRVSDQIKDHFGAGAIWRGSSPLHPPRRRRGDSDS